MDERHGADAVLTIAKLRHQGGIINHIGLQLEQTRDDLQIIFYPMVHFLEEEIFLAQGRGELRLGLAALREFLLGLSVELGILNRDGGMCGEAHEELLVPVREGVKRGVGNVKYPIDARASQDRYGQYSNVPTCPGPGQILFAEAWISGIVVRAPGTRGAEHLSPHTLARLNAETGISHLGSTDCIASGQDVRVGLPKHKNSPF